MSRRSAFAYQSELHVSAFSPLCPPRVLNNPVSLDKIHTNNIYSKLRVFCFTVTSENATFVIPRIIYIYDSRKRAFRHDVTYHFRLAVKVVNLCYCHEVLILGLVTCFYGFNEWIEILRRNAACLHHILKCVNVASSHQTCVVVRISAEAIGRHITLDQATNSEKSSISDTGRN